MQHSILKSLVRLFLLLIVSVLCIQSIAAKRNDDVVILKNGDRITGEIKGLSRGELRFKASYMAEAVRLDWARVERLESKDQYQILLTNGELHTDSLQLIAANSGHDNFFIGATQGTLKVNQLDVIRIAPVEKEFLTQLEGSVDFGFSYTSGNDQYDLELVATATYRRGNNSMTGRIDSLFSGQTEGSSSARNQFTFDYRRQVSPKWFVGGVVDVLRSDQQSLDRRLTFGGLVGRNIKQNESTRLSVFAGLAATREKYSTTLSQPSGTNADAFAGVDLIRFRFTTTDISTRFIIFPSLTTPGRMRMQATSDMRIKIAKDLYWGFHVYENFDSQPPVRADKNDLGISTSIGWKF